MRSSLRSVSYKHMKEVATDLKAIYSASTEAEAELQLNLFAEKWDARYASISMPWFAHWARIIPLFAFPGEIRKVIYPTNATPVAEYDAAQSDPQSPHLPVGWGGVQGRLAFRRASLRKKWTMPIHDWKPALNRFAVEFGERFPPNETRAYFSVLELPYPRLHRLWGGGQTNCE